MAARTKNGRSSFTDSRCYFIFRGASVICAGFLVHLSLGTIYTTGNLLPYVVSYTRARSHPADLTAATGAWIGALNVAGQGTTMLLGGWLERRIGPRFSTLFGGWLMSAGVLLSFFTVKVSFWLFLLTYGLVFGLGVGIAYVGPLSCAMRWMPRWKGVAGGFVVAGFGLGALIFNQVQSLYINPHNLKPDENGDFSNKDLLDRVPYIFLVLGGTYAVMQFIGCLFIVNPPHYLHSQPSTKKDSKTPTNGRKISKKVKKNDFLHVNDGTVTPTTHDSFPSDPDTSLSEDELESESDPLITSNEDPYGRSDINYHRETKALTGPMEGTHPLKVIRTFNFYHLWVMFLLAGFAVNFIGTLYKVYGLTFIDNDHFLAIVGSTSAILNCTGRIVWGLIADRFSFKTSLALQSGLMTISMCTFYATSVMGKPAFFVWVCIIFFCVGGNFSVFPASIAVSFGQKYMSINYGLLFTSQISSGIVAAILFTTLLKLLEWDGTMFLVSGISLVGFLVTLGFVYRRYY